MKKCLIVSVLLSTPLFVFGQTNTFNSDLTLGSSGNDVSTLQTFLISSGFDIPAISSGISKKGYFGAQTKSAVIKYQVSVGLPSTGYVGPLTRARLGRGSQTIVSAPVAVPVVPVGVPLGTISTVPATSVASAPSSVPPVIDKIDGPSSISVNQKITWTVRAHDPNKGDLKFSVDWGDVYHGVSEGADALPVTQSAETATFSHVYKQDCCDRYGITFTVMNDAGQETKDTQIVRVNRPQPKIPPYVHEVPERSWIVAAGVDGSGSYNAVSYVFQVITSDSPVYISTSPSESIYTQNKVKGEMSLIPDPLTLEGDTSTYYFIPAHSSRAFTFGTTMYLSSLPIISKLYYGLSPANLKEGSLFNY
jgi:peptidoglycan hydrolase-like protein with peptidoglycan-binding domain